VLPDDHTPPSTQRIDAALVRVERRTRLRFEGRLVSSGSAHELARCLRGFHNDTIRRGAGEVVVDVTALTWACEAAVTAFVAWIMWIACEPPSSRYRVAFRLDPDSSWQQGAFGTLSSVVPRIVETSSGPRRLG